MSLICVVLLTGLIFFNLGKSFFQKDKSQIWSPITVISLTYIYYCIVPYWRGTIIDEYSINETSGEGALFHIAALLSFVFIMIGFRCSSNSTNFRRWNSLISTDNVGKYGLLIFIIGIVGYGIVRGFHLSFVGAAGESRAMTTGGFTYYFMMMLDMLPFASGLLLVKLKNNWRQVLYLVPFWFILVDFLVAGARWRIVVMLLVIMTLFHLYPSTRKINVPFLAGLAILVFLGFSVMDKARTRGVGIDMSIAKELTFDDVKEGAAENYSVYWFSVKCMNYIQRTGERVYFEPIVTSIFMPIPRSLFPWKPDAAYLDFLDEMFDDGGGAAYLNFVESYYSFGWFGVLFYAWLLGWLARKFWDNYLNNRKSIGAITALGAFSGFCYVAISRGYLPATITTFILAICLPFWIIQLLERKKIYEGV